LLEQVNQLQTQFNNFDARLERLLAVESNYLEISEIVESYDQKLEEFQANLQRIANQQEILERERQNFNNLVNNLNIKIQLLESSNDEFRSLNLSSSLETLRYNIQNLELMDSEQERKLEEFQTTLQKQKETIQANIDELMLKISNQQEILEREKQSFNNLVNNLNVKIQLLESSNNEFKSFNLSSSLENIRFNIQDIGRMNSDREIKLNEIERTIYNKLEVFETNLQKQKDRIQTDINKIANQQETFKKDFNNLSNDLSIKIQLIESNNNEFKNLGSNLESLKFNIQNLGHMNSDQEIKLNEIERTLNHFINEERKHLTRQLERNRKAVIFAILSSWLGVILGAIALWQLR
jgi:chromosome segregation ATPase